MKVTNVTVTKEATLEVGNITYLITYLIKNDLINSISVSIRKRVGEKETATLNEVGIIRKENGQINSNILEGEDLLVHYKQFIAIVAEIEKQS